MSVIIRLQNLPWSANALDIRQYFAGLSIPEGGVHIVGGELGDAFIAFSTDEDARQAFNRNNGKIKEVQISLLLSSRQEMQKIIESARNPLAAFMQTPQAPLPPIIPPMNTSGMPLDQKKDDRREDSKSRDDRRDSKRRSRSKSRDRRDRSRDRDRRDRRRDRSRSRDRRDRRRDRRSRSRDRTRSKDRDRRSRDKRRDDGKRDDGKNGSDSSANNQGEGDLRWEPPLQNEPLLPQNQNPVQNPLLAAAMVQQQQLQRGIIPPIGGLGGLPLLGNNMPLPNALPPQIRESWPPMMNMRNQNVDGPNPMNRMNNFRGPSNLDMDRGDQQNNFNRIPPAFHNNMDNRQNNGPNGHFHNNRPFPDRHDNRMGFGRPPMGGQFNRDMNTPPGQDFNNFNDQGGRRQGPNLPNCCVQLRPFYGGYGEIRRFFNGAFINNTGLKFVNDDQGKRSGIVYVRFVMPEGKQMALQRSGSLLKGVPVEVKHLDDEEFERFQEPFRRPPFGRDGDDGRNQRPGGMPHQQQPQRPQGFDSPTKQDNSQSVACIALENLPNFVKERHIMKLFSDYPMISFMVVRLRIQRDQCLAAYVKLMKVEDAKEILSDKSLHFLEGKPILVRPCNIEEFEDVSRQHNSGKSLIDPPSQLSQLGVIEIDDKSDEENNDNDDDDDDDVRYDNSNKSDCVFLKGLPFKISERDVADFFSDIGVVPTRIHMKSHGECYCEFTNAKKAEISLQKNDTNLGTSVVRVEMISREDMGRELNSNTPNPGGNSRMHSPGPQNFNQRFSFGRPGGPRPPPGHMGGPMGFRGPPRRPGVVHSHMGAPGCGVSMSNVPYKANTEEIVEFFEGFDVSPSDVLRRTENGKPTGDAIVTFGSPVEAQRAIEEFNHNSLRDRTIFLAIAPGPGGLKPPY